MLEISAIYKDFILKIQRIRHNCAAQKINAKFFDILADLVKQP